MSDIQVFFELRFRFLMRLPSSLQEGDRVEYAPYHQESL